MTPERIFVKPAEDRKVRKPTGPTLAAQGEWVNRDSYWDRRILDGDAVIDPNAVEAPAEKPATGRTK